MIRSDREPKRQHAFSRADLLVIAAIIIGLGALAVASLGKAKAKSSRISCVNLLKQVGLAYLVWSGDNGDLFPMQVSTNLGGSRELAALGDAVSSYRVMSNELSVAKNLACPNDSIRTSATNFFHLSRANVSYFVGVDAGKSNATLWLSGDRNLTVSSPHRGPLLEVTSRSLPQWGPEIHKNRSGNVGFPDGSVMQFSTASLQDHVANSASATNRLAIP